MTTVAHAVEVLNRALAADPDATNELIQQRFRCNQALLDDPTIQCSNDTFFRNHKVAILSERPIPSVGILGLINGIFGIREDGGGHIVAVYDDETHKLLRFEER